MRNARLIGAVAALGCAISSFAAQAQTHYTMQILPDLNPDFPVSFPAAINDRGEVVGSSRTVAAQQLTAVIWSRNGSIRALDPDADVIRSEALALNNRSDAVGDKFTPPGSQPFGHTAFLWERRGPVDLGDLPGGQLESEAQNINDAGEIVGQACDDTGCRAFLAGRDHALQVLPVLPGSLVSSNARAINDRGEIVGFSSSGPSGRGKAVMWREGEVIELPSLPGNDPVSNASDINNRGQIVGSSAGRAVLWENDQVIQLPALAGYGAPQAFAINERGTIVGGAVLTEGGAEHAIVWENGAMADLENLVIRTPDQPTSDRLGLTFAQDINERGQILVLARDFTDENNRPVAVVLTPTRH